MKSKIDKISLRQKIKKEINDTSLKILQLKEQSQPISPENSLGRISRMDAVNNKSVIEASLREAQHKLMLLQTALEKINRADFGICTGCRNPIPEGRLMLIPHSTKCVNCA